MTTEMIIVWLSRETLDSDWGDIELYLFQKSLERCEDYFMVTQYEHGSLRHMTQQDYKTGIGFKDAQEAMLFKLRYGGQ